MPFVRFSRDKRGYVYVFLVDVPGKQGRGAPRVLYWFRTPPGLKVGRDAFDEDTRATIESRYPHLTFDWQQIVNTPLPPAEVVTWRERRRQERAQKKAALADEPDEASIEVVPGDGQLEAEDTPDSGTGAAFSAAETPAADIQAHPPHASGADQSRRRRRRRGGRSRRGAPSAGPGAEPAPDVGAASESPITFEGADPPEEIRQDTAPETARPGDPTS